MIRWLYILFGCVRAMLTWRTRSDFVESKNVYEIIRAPLKFFLATAFLEIFHAMLKLVKSSPIITFNQVFIRFLVVWGIVENFYTVLYFCYNYQSYLLSLWLHNNNSRLKETMVSSYWELFGLYPKLSDISTIFRSWSVSTRILFNGLDITSL